MELSRTIFIVLILIHQFTFSQSEDDFISKSVAYLVELGEEDNIDIESITFELIEIHQNKIDINNSSSSEIGRCPLLTAQQVQQILTFRSTNGEITSLIELKHVEGFSIELIKLLPYYFTANALTNDKITNQILVRNQFQIQEKKGFNDSIAIGYKGTRDKTLIKYKVSDSKYTLALTMEKDEGENYLVNRRLNIDHFCGHFERKQKSRRIIIGDYTLNTGQGLVFANGYQPKFSNAALNSNLFQSKLKGYSSTLESGFFRGLAMEQQINNLSFTGFISHDYIDTNLDSLNQFSSISTSGLHRTSLEKSRKENTQIFTVGQHSQLDLHNLNVGLNTLYYQYNAKPTANEAYQTLRTNQQENLFTSINTNYYLNNYNLFGEIAINKSFNTAMYFGGSAILSDRIISSLTFRSYSPKYQNIYSDAFGKSSSTNNEDGINFRLQYDFSRDEKLIVNSDFYRFPWLKYLIDNSSNGYRVSFQYEKSKRDKWQLKTLAKIESYEFRKYQLRFDFTSDVSENSAIRFRSEIKRSNNKNGWLTYLSFKKKTGYHFSFYARWTLFSIKDFDNRIYTYENDVLYGSSIPFFYNSGQKFLLLMKYKINNSLSVWLKATHLVYSDLENVGSGLDEIAGNKKTAIKFQLIWKT